MVSAMAVKSTLAQLVRLGRVAFAQPPSRRNEICLINI